MSTATMEGPIDYSKPKRASVDDFSRESSPVPSEASSRSLSICSESDTNNTNRSEVEETKQREPVTQSPDGAAAVQATGTGLRSPTNTLRPFKMYSSVDPLSLIYHNSAALAAAIPETSELYSTYAATSNVSALAGLGGMSANPLTLDNLIPPYSPLASFISRRKRAPASTEPGAEPEQKRAKPEPEEKKDEFYWDRRRKNNYAAKRSRDSRKAKEEEIAMRASFLEQENLKLRAQVAVLRSETSKLHTLLYSRT